MNVAYYFEDMARSAGSEAIRMALDTAQWVALETWPFEEARSPLAIAARPFAWRDYSTLRCRQYLYGYELRRRQLSAVVAPGAAGKTTSEIGRAICMAAGRDFLGNGSGRGLTECGCGT